MSIHPPLWPSETQPAYNTDPTAYSTYDYTQDPSYPYQDAPQYDQDQHPIDNDYTTNAYNDPYNRDPDQSQSPSDPSAHLNLLVLRRHNPSIIDILCIASFATIYSFSFQSGEWEKTGVEGPLFVVRLAPQPRRNTDDSDDGLDEDGNEWAAEEEEEETYAIVVLNRKHLDNFTVPIRDPSALDLSEEHIQILAERSESSDSLQPYIETSKDEARTGNEALAEDGPDPEKTVAYGMWIWNEAGKSTEGAREHVADTVVECARRALESRVRVEEGRRRRREERLARRQRVEQQRVYEEQMRLREQQMAEQQRVQEEQGRLYEQQQRTRDQLRMVDRSRAQVQQQQRQQNNKETQGYVHAFDRQRAQQSPQQYAQRHMQRPQTQAEGYDHGSVRSSGHQQFPNGERQKYGFDAPAPASTGPSGRQLDLLQLFGSQRGPQQSQRQQQQTSQQPSQPSQQHQQPQTPYEDRGPPPPAGRNPLLDLFKR